VRHVYAALHQVLHDAVVDEVIPANPCVLKRGELPPKIDKDPTWRPGAVFTREEVEALCSDPRIPEDRRVLYGIELLTGMRSGEAAALPWRAYDPTPTPLGRLVVGILEGRVLTLRPAAEVAAVGDGLETAFSAEGVPEEKARRSEPSGP
jgi:hypothetical protein